MNERMSKLISFLFALIFLSLTYLCLVSWSPTILTILKKQMNKILFGQTSKIKMTLSSTYSYSQKVFLPNILQLIFNNYLTSPPLSPNIL